MKLDDDDSSFDPRLAWAKINHEDLSHLIFEKQRFDKDMELLKFLEIKPRTTKEVMAHLHWKDWEVARGVQYLKKRGVIFNITRTRRVGTTYEVITRPLRFYFTYPKTTERYH